MEIDVTKFNCLNVIDTCAIWNILSSKVFYSTSRNAGCYFTLTNYVRYECLEKPRTNPSGKEFKLQHRLKGLLNKNEMECYELSIADLQDVGILRSRKKLGMGELSSIAFAKKINQSFLTDDREARKFAANIITKQKVQTTPHLLGWLFFKGELLDGDLDPIIKEHIEYERQLGEFFREVYIEALRCKAMFKSTGNN